MPSALAMEATESAVLDSMELKELEQMGDSVSFDVRDSIGALLSGEMDLSKIPWQKALQEIAASIGVDFWATGIALLTPLIVSVLIKQVLGANAAAQKSVQFICRIVCVSALAGAFANLIRVSSSVIDTVAQCSRTLTPVLVSAVALSGAESTAATFTPMAAVCADLIQWVLNRWSIALASAAAVIAIAGNLSPSIRLKRLHGLIRQLMIWIVGIMLTTFMGALSMQGRISAGRDTAATRTARYAIESIVPVIGNDISDSLDTLLATAFNIKNALGATGLMLILWTCLIPLCRLAGTTVLLKLTSAVAEPLGDDSLANMTAQFAEASEMLLIAVVASLMLVAMLVGSCMTAASGIVR